MIHHIDDRTSVRLYADPLSGSFVVSMENGDDELMSASFHDRDSAVNQLLCWAAGCTSSAAWMAQKLMPADPMAALQATEAQWPNGTGPCASSARREIK